MSRDLAVIVPTRGRPENICKVISAWDFTNAWDVADLILAVDADDPKYQEYLDLFEEHRHPDTGDQLFSLVTRDVWAPMVHKLNWTAVGLAESRRYFAVGFAGDDHLPRTINWAQTYLEKLRELGTGMVFGDDGYQGRNLSTEWAVTSDAVRALGRMVPAPVQHMYCDNSIMGLFDAAGALVHLPGVRIEHMHPIAGKAEQDDQYRRVNHRDQFAVDKAAFEAWRRTQKPADVETIKKLRAGRPTVPGVKRGRTSVAPTVSPFPKTLKQVPSNLPVEVEITLADLAAQVPDGQEIVQLGVGNARVCMVLAWGASQGAGAHVTGLDPWELDKTLGGDPSSDRAWARYWVRSLSFTNTVTLEQTFSQDKAMAPWLAPPVGLLSVGLDCPSADIRGWLIHLADDGLVAIDGYGTDNAVRRGVDALVDLGLITSPEVYHGRLAVSRVIPQESAPVSDREELEAEWRRVDPEGVAALEQSAAELDVESSIRSRVGEHELAGAHYRLPIEKLNTYQLRALARERGIKLGVRKDKRDAMLQALRDGK